MLKIQPLTTKHGGKGQKYIWLWGPCAQISNPWPPDYESKQNVLRVYHRNIKTLSTGQVAHVMWRTNSDTHVWPDLVHAQKASL